LVRRQENQKTIHSRYRSGFVAAFPIYNKNKIIKEEYSPGIYVEQQAIGFVGYELNIESFDLEDYNSNLLQFNDKTAIATPPLQSKKLRFRKKKHCYLSEWF
jgi:hypothetical protein